MGLGKLIILPILRFILSHYDTVETHIASDPDDVWPEYPYPGVSDRLWSDGDYPEDKVYDSEIAVMQDETFPEEIRTDQQWGLRLPSSEVAWGSWSGIDFTTPLDRLRMVATLQKTALEMGFDEGDQTQVFLNNYTWCVRERKSKISYGNSISYSLTDPQVSASAYREDNDGTDDTGDNLSADLHQGSVGGDAR